MSIQNMNIYVKIYLIIIVMILKFIFYNIYNYSIQLKKHDTNMIFGICAPLSPKKTSDLFEFKTECALKNSQLHHFTSTNLCLWLTYFS